MSSWTVTFKCIDGGHGWGETDAINKIGGFQNMALRDVIDHAHQLMPGGWKIIKVEEVCE